MLATRQFFATLFNAPLARVRVDCNLATPAGRRLLYGSGSEPQLALHVAVRLASTRAAADAAGKLRTQIAAGTFAQKLTEALPSAVRARVNRVVARCARGVGRVGWVGWGGWLVRGRGRRGRVAGGGAPS